MSLIEDLPENWEPGAVEEASAWRYHHRYLDVEIAVDADDGYEVAVRRASAAAGIVEDGFAPDGPIADRADARDWARAVMSQIDREFAPAATDYAAGPMRTLGGEVGGATDGEADVTTCPVCEAPLFQYRGTSVAEQARSHVEFMNDDPHAELAADIEERIAPSEDDRGSGAEPVGPARGARGNDAGRNPRDPDG